MVSLTTNIKGTNIELTSDVYREIEKVTNSLNKLISGHEVDLLNVEVGRTTKHHQHGNVCFAELQLMHPGTKSAEFRTRVEDERIVIALGKAREELIRQLRRAKEKGITSKRKHRDRV